MMNASHSDVTTLERPKFWSEADCREIMRRLARVTTGGGYTTLSVWSTWTGYVRWARNLVSTAGETRDNIVLIYRDINAAYSSTVFANDVSDAGLAAAARRAEYSVRLRPEHGPSAAFMREPYPDDEAPRPAIFSEATYQLDAARRAEAARRLAALAAGQGMLSAGYVQVAAHALAFIDTLGHSRYFPFTQAQFSVTVRDPKGTGSGWAGDSHWDWGKLEPEHLIQVALDKCVKSQTPVRLEPGRYTAILEPQAVADFVGQLVTAPGLLWRNWNEDGIPPGPFNKTPARQTPTGSVSGFARFGERVIDERLTISTDPTDPELGYPPFDLWNSSNYFSQGIFHAATWIRNGVLTALGYDREYARAWLGRVPGLPNPGGFRMSVSGPTQGIDEMVKGTKRGVLVTRFDQVQLLNAQSTLCHGYTRDGLWLIEDGKISKSVKNFQFTETILGKLNSVEQLGTPMRTFHPLQPGIGSFPQPVIVPAMKLSDFSFTALSDAV